MRLVLGLRERELDRAARASGIFGKEQRPLTRGHGLRHAAAGRPRTIPRQRVHEAHRRSALDAVDQHVGQAVDLRVVELANAV